MVTCQSLLASRLSWERLSAGLMNLGGEEGSLSGELGGDPRAGSFPLEKGLLPLFLKTVWTPGCNWVLGLWYQTVERILIGWVATNCLWSCLSLAN